MSAFFYRDNSGKEIGPLDFDTLAKLRAVGVLNDNTMLRSESSAEWKPLRELLPASTTAETPQKSSSRTFSWTWAGLAVAGVIILVTWRSENISGHSNIPHAVEAEQAFRKQMDNDPTAFKLIHFEATNGEPVSSSGAGNSYRIEFIAKSEALKDLAFGSDLKIHRGETLTFSGSMFGTESDRGWIFEACTDLKPIDSSNPQFLIVAKRNRPISQANACINNLRQIDAAANQFALEYHKRTGDSINFPSDLTPYIYLPNGKMPSCPAGGIYTINRVGDTPTCSLGNTVTPNHVLP